MDQINKQWLRYSSYLDFVSFVILSESHRDEAKNLLSRSPSWRVLSNEDPLSAFGGLSMTNGGAMSLYSTSYEFFPAEKELTGESVIRYG